MTQYAEEWLFAPADTGERRRRSDGGPATAELIDAQTVQSIADETWVALVGEDEFLVPLREPLPVDVVSSWVEVLGPWNGAVVLTLGRDTAAELTRCLLKQHAPEVLEPEDVDDALGELANVIGGNVKGILPSPSLLGLPEVGSAPAPSNPADVVRIDVVWRGQPLSVAVQGARRVRTP